MTGKKQRQPGEEPEMTFEAPDTVPIPESAADEPERRPGGLGVAAMASAGLAASGAIDPGSTSAADEDTGQDPTPFDDSLDVFDTLQPGDDLAPFDTPAQPDSDVIDSIYGAQSTAGGGFTLTGDDPELDFSPIDFSIVESPSSEPDPTSDITTGATAVTGGGHPQIETPAELSQPLAEPLDTNVAELDVIDEDDGEDEDLGD